MFATGMPVNVSGNNTCRPISRAPMNGPIIAKRGLRRHVPVWTGGPHER